ncbi:ABC transporter permease [Microbacterium paludicola]|uniref:ABC transporter permease n=1 Tax=Microbacterium paludicola TaxID=300019 RepID=UPI001D162326|nr:ABC transporter permease [Microbacterium paludicola]
MGRAPTRDTRQAGERLVTATTVGRQGSTRRYFHAMWLLSSRDLRVKYATTWLGYIWAVLDPLLMCAIYWFLFTVVFERHGGVEPYAMFLISGLLPWQWFTTAVSDSTSAFTRDKKLVRSTGASNTIWVGRVVLSSAVSYALTFPILAAALLLFQMPIGPGIVWFPVAFLLQAVLCVGLGLVLAPLCILISDLARVTKLVIRVLFFCSPILFDLSHLPEWLQWVDRVNPMYGILTMYRLGYWPELWNTGSIVASFAISFGILALGIIVFPVLVRPVLKDL